MPQDLQILLSQLFLDINFLEGFKDLVQEIDFVVVQIDVYGFVSRFF